MPRYFFDIHDGESATPDDSGIDLEGPEQVRYEAIRALPDIARDELPDGDRHVFQVRVRDEGGHPVFEAQLVLCARWIDDDANSGEKC